MFMSKNKKQIIAIGGGRMRLNETRIIDEYIAGLTNKKKSRIVFFPTASFDLEEYIEVFRKTYTDWGVDVAVIDLVKNKWDLIDIKTQINRSDFIYIGGGDVEFLVSEFKKNKIDQLLHEAYKMGIAICGLSAGAAILFDEFLFHKDNQWLREKGFCLLSGVCLPHYSGDVPINVLKKCSMVSSVIAIPDKCAIHYVDNKYYNTLLSNNLDIYEINTVNDTLTIVEIEL